MKSSTLHRSSLSRERMTMLERARMANMDMNEIPQYRQAKQDSSRGTERQGVKVPELDVLYKNFQNGIRRPGITVKKTPGVYLGIGFVLGVLFMFIISLIVGLSSMNPKQQQLPAPKQATTSVAIVASDKKPAAQELSEEKYTIKRGDTLDKIAFRFYGKYDNEKIKQIQILNNIKSPTELQIGQVIIVPVAGQ